MKLAASLLVALSLSPAFADETVKIYPPGSAQDVLEKGDRDPSNPTGKDGGALILKHDCMTSKGKVVKKGQPGYETCLQERMDRAQKPAPDPANQKQ